MTTFTRTWNPAYEALPPDTENAKNGAERINQTKVDTRERLEVDHSMAGDVDDGTHKQVTFVDPLASKPTAVANQGFLYTKDVGGNAELFYEDELGNELQMTALGNMFVDLMYPVGAIYASTVSTSPATLFGGTWVALSDKQTLVQAGTYVAGSTGGNSTAVNVSHTHGDNFTIDAAGAHTHTIDVDTTSGGSTPVPAGGSGSLDLTQTTSSNGSHNHGISGAVSAAGVSGANANMPPYLAVYMWKRTA